MNTQANAAAAMQALGHTRQEHLNYKEMSEDEQQQHFEALLQSNVKDIRTLPDFATFPPGSYHFLVESVKANMAERQIVVVMSLQQALEVANANEVVPPVGSKYSERYDFKFDGVERFVKVWGAAGSELGADTPVGYIDVLAGTNVVATITRRADKKDATKQYNNIKAVALVA